MKDSAASLTAVELEGKRRSHQNCDGLGLGEWWEAGADQVGCSMPHRRSSHSPNTISHHNAWKLGCGVEYGGVSTRQL